VAVPILRQGTNLIVTIQASLSDTELLALASELARRAGSVVVRTIVIDVSALDVMDSFSVRVLRNIAQSVRLRGARLLVVGIQPEVAFAMVQLGLTLEDIDTALDLDDGISAIAQPAPGASRG
jgi:rsbT antagonist protein RsbS